MIIQTLYRASEGTWTYDDEGTVKFTPDSGFIGNPTPIHYVVYDNQGQASNTGTIEVQYSSVTDIIVPGEGAWHLNTTTGEVTFTPEVGFSGTTTPIYYTVQDNQGQTSNTASITVQYTLTGTTLVVQNISSAQAIGKPVLTQQNTLTAKNIAQSQSVGTVSLTQQNTLNVKNIGQSQNLYNIVLAQGFILSPANILSGQTVQTFALSSQNALAISNILSSQSVGKPLLTQQNILAVKSISSLQDIEESYAFVSYTLIGVNNVSQSQNLSVPAISFIAFLNMTNVFQQQALSTVSLTQQNVLSAKSIMQTQDITETFMYPNVSVTAKNIQQTESIPGVSLAQQNIIVVKSISESSTISTVTLTQQNVLSIFPVVSNQYLGKIVIAIDPVSVIIDNISQNSDVGSISLNLIPVRIYSGKPCYIKRTHFPVYPLTSSK